MEGRRDGGMEGRRVAGLRFMTTVISSPGYLRLLHLSQWRSGVLFLRFHPTWFPAAGNFLGSAGRHGNKGVSVLISSLARVGDLWDLFNLRGRFAAEASARARLCTQVLLLSIFMAPRFWWKCGKAWPARSVPNLLYRYRTYRANSSGRGWAFSDESY